MLTKLSLKNGSIVVLVSILLLIAGVYAIPNLGIEFLPEIAPPVVSIVTIYPNASPENVANDITKPVEEAVGSISSLKQLSSVSNENVSIIIAEFSYGSDMDKITKDVSDAVNKIKNDLPDSAQDPKVTRFNMSDAPIMSLSVSSDGDQSQTSKIVKDIIKPELDNIEGVADVVVSGLAEKRLEVILDPDKLKEQNLTSSQIVQVLKANNLTIPGGTLDIGSKTIPVQTVSKIKTKKDLENLIVSVSVDQDKVKELQEKGIKDAQAKAMQAQAAAMKKMFGAFGAAQQQMIEKMKSSMPTIPNIPNLSNIPGGIAPGAIPSGIPGNYGGGVPGSIPSMPGGLIPPSGYPSQNPQQNIPHQGGQTSPQTQQPSSPTTILPAMPPAGVSPDDVFLEQQSLLNKNSLYKDSLSESYKNEIKNKLSFRKNSLNLTVVRPAVYRGNSVRTILVANGGSSSFNSSANMSSMSMGMTGTSSEDIPLKYVYLKDIAKVKETYDPGTSIYCYNKRPSIGIDIKKGSKQNTVAVADAVIEKIPDLEERAGLNTKIRITNNQSEYIKSAIEGMVREGLLGAIFAILVIFYFLRNVRSTLVSAISIPLSVIIGLIFLYAADISLNVFTLGGITIAIGRVVDDSIVVLENIFRHMQTTDEPRLVSVINGTKEVSRAITSSTITTIAVFLPLGFVKGFVGELFRPFAYTVSLTLAASLLVALTIVPLLASKFMSKEKLAKAHSKEENIMKQAYQSILGWSLNHKGIVIVLSLALFIGSMALMSFIPKNFINMSNRGTITIDIKMPVGTSLTTTSNTVAKIEDILAKDNRIDNFRSTIGASQSSYSSGGGSDRAVIYVTTKEKYKEKKDSIITDIKTKIKNLKNKNKIDKNIKIVLSGAEQTAGMSNTINVYVKANTYQKLKEANAILLDKLEKVKEVGNISSNLSESKPELWVAVDEQEAMKQGLTAIQVAAIVRGAINGETATTIDSNGKSTDVFVSVDRNKIKDHKTLAGMYIQTPLGKKVRLSQIANVSYTKGPVSVTRIDQERSATITMEPLGKNTDAASRAVKNTIKDTDLPTGCKATTGGVSTMMEEGFSSMGLAIIVAILLVYIVMVGTFRSLLHPFTMLFSLPLAAIGAMLALFITGRTLGMPSLIGLLMLVGIVVTNAIVLLDLVQQLRARGENALDAIVQAGSTRMRPILMTALATILALVPMALSSSEGGIISAPLATVVIGGLFTSTFLTLVIIPVLYMVFDSIRNRIGMPENIGLIDKELDLNSEIG